MNVLGSIAAQLDKVLVFTYLGPLQLAVYSFAIAPPEQANHLRKIVRTLALPKLSTQTAEELKRFLPYKVWLGVLAMGGVVLGYYFIAPHFFALVLPQYIDSVWYSQVYALVLLFAPTIILHQALVAKKEQKALYVVNTAIPILKIALMFLLLPLYGVMGAIIGTIVTRGINTALLIYFFRSMR
jgi:O-antigen/teichoic acid export membrane protein